MIRISFVLANMTVSTNRFREIIVVGRLNEGLIPGSSTILNCVFHGILVLFKTSDLALATFRRMSMHK